MTNLPLLAQASMDMATPRFPVPWPMNMVNPKLYSPATELSLSKSQIPLSGQLTCCKVLVDLPEQCDQLALSRLWLCPLAL